MSEEPTLPRAMAFIDGQNLFRHAKEAFGHYHPNFDPLKLHRAICEEHGWLCSVTRLYTGVPDPEHDPRWTDYWNNRILHLKRAGVYVTQRTLHYHREEVVLPDGGRKIRYFGREKGIDIRIALDIVHLARKRNFDIAILFSQDQDLREVVDEVKDIAREQERAIAICCPFPDGPRASSKRGINGTNWFRMNQAFYDACLDPRDYRTQNWK